MPSTVDLVVRVLADTSQAGASFSGFSKNIGAALGIGASGAAAGIVVAASTEAAIKQQAAMARIQASYNNVDFAPGTAAYTASVQEIIQQSQTLATSMEDVAGVHNQAARFVDDFGNRLPKDEVTAYTDSVLKLAKVSLDDIAPTDLEAKIATFEKLSNQTNFSPVANAIAASSAIHSQGEGQMLDSAIAILQAGGPLGVTQSQAGGLANYLTDLGQGGQRGGMSIGRMLLRQDAAAREELDPEIGVGKAKKARESQEHMDDLQTSLREAEASRAQMFGQHGLKTQFQKNPEAVMQSEDRIAKLNREIADAKADQITDAQTATKKGQYNIGAMAQTAGMSPQDYAQLARDNPVEALLDFTRGLHELPATERGAALAASGIGTSQKDVSTINLLQERPDVIAQQIDTFQQQLDHPTALDQMSGIALATTEAKQADVGALKQNTLAAAGEESRKQLDTFDDWILKIGKDAGDSATPLGQFVEKFGGFGATLFQVAPLLAPFVAQKLLGGGAAGAAGLGSAGAAGAAGGTSVAAVAGVAALAAFDVWGANKVLDDSGVKAKLLSGQGLGGNDFGSVMMDASNADAARRQAQIAGFNSGLPPVEVNTGDINITSQADIERHGEAVKQAVISTLHKSWLTASSSTPVSGALGGNVGAASPAH